MRLTCIHFGTLPNRQPLVNRPRRAPEIPEEPTWNEVVTALDLYLPRGSDFLMPRDEDFAADNLGQDIQCTIYEYPDRFTEGGYPVFLNNDQ
jgi:hypothetical protein